MNSRKIVRIVSWMEKFTFNTKSREELTGPLNIQKRSINL